jgi:hypothetical protein
MNFFDTLATLCFVSKSTLLLCSTIPYLQSQIVGTILFKKTRTFHEQPNITILLVAVSVEPQGALKSRSAIT